MTTANEVLSDTDMPFDRRAADSLADEVAMLVHRGTIDARSPAADALLDYRERPVPLTHRIGYWLTRVLGRDCAVNRKERARRLVEEAVELAQAEGVCEADVLKIADRVYTRPVGEPGQEAAGVMVCLLAWEYASGENLRILTKREVTRVEGLDPAAIRKKHNAKADAGTALRAEV